MAAAARGAAADGETAGIGAWYDRVEEEWEGVVVVVRVCGLSVRMRIRMDLGIDVLGEGDSWVLPAGASGQHPPASSSGLA